MKTFVFLWLWVALSAPVFGEECEIYERYPIAGHPVDIVSLHQADKNYTLFVEIKKTRLILMEPGVCKNKNLKGWFAGRFFIIKSFTDSFIYGDTIKIEAGLFR